MFDRLAAVYDPVMQVNVERHFGTHVVRTYGSHTGPAIRGRSAEGLTTLQRLRPLTALYHLQ